MLVEILQRPEDPLKILNTAARQCYFRGYAPEETGENLSESAQKRRIEKIIKHGHTSIIEHISYTFGIKGISRACSHQLVRTRAGIVFSQQSQRYCDFSDISESEFIVPEKIKQNKYSYADYMKILENFSKEYKEFSEKYVSIENEDIRYLLPNATPTNIIMTINARALLNLFQTRLCSHAQTEIRTLCEKMRELLKQEFFIFAMPEFDAKCQSLKRCPSGTNCRKI